jgi:Zn-dependent protease with chaperone function
MYDFLGICLALAALLTVNAVVSLFMTAAWRFFSRFTSGWSAATRARFIFILQTFPATAALLVVAVFLVPSYLAFEPRQTVETVGIKLGLLALFSAAGIALAFWRGIAAWLATRKLVGDWRTHSETVSLENLPIPAYRINHQFPVVAVIGVARPKLFVANQIFDSLNKDELAAVFAHETAHIAARDNLKHWLMRICRDVLVIVPSNRLLDKEWAEAIELAADEEASNRKPGGTAFDLAQALIKIARLVPKGIKPTMPAGSFLIGSEAASGDALTRRITRLMELPHETIFNKNWKTRLASNFNWICLGLLFLAAVMTATNSDVLAAMHAAIERVVSALS